MISVVNFRVDLSSVCREIWRLGDTPVEGHWEDV